MQGGQAKKFLFYLCPRSEVRRLEQQKMKQIFMESAVHVVARDGLEKATTKAIAAQAGLNEAYIY